MKSFVFLSFALVIISASNIGVNGDVKPYFISVYEEGEILPVPTKCPKQDKQRPVHIAHEKDCNKFYKCSHGKPYLQYCPEGLHFNPRKQICDHPGAAGCSLITPPTTESTTPKPTTITTQATTSTTEAITPEPTTATTQATNSTTEAITPEPTTATTQATNSTTEAITPEPTTATTQATTSTTEAITPEPTTATTQATTSTTEAITPEPTTATTQATNSTTEAITQEPTTTTEPTTPPTEPTSPKPIYPIIINIFIKNSTVIFKSKLH